MEMTMAVSAMPAWQSALLIVGIGTFVGIAGPVLFRRAFGIERLRINNEVAGFKFAVVGVVYAVLLGFAIVVVWEKFHDAESAVVQEVGAIASLYRLSGGLEKPAAELIQAQLQTYAHTVITDDWPAMNHGTGSRAVSSALDALYAAVMLHKDHGPGEIAILQEMLNQLDTMTQARQARLSLAEGIIPGVVWMVLVTGAFICVIFTFFFGTSSLVAQVMMNGLLSLLIFMALFVIVEINYPFTGPFSVPPAPLIEWLARV
jgi:Na+/proline symporter